MAREGIAQTERLLRRCLILTFQSFTVLHDGRWSQVEKVRYLKTLNY
jgi:protein-disulfide isomerase-like protein with CxxC motif